MIRPSPHDHYVIPVSPGRAVVIAGPWPLTPDEWARMLEVLELFRPGLVDDVVYAEILEADP